MKLVKSEQQERLHWILERKKRSGIDVSSLEEVILSMEDEILHYRKRIQGFLDSGADDRKIFFRCDKTRCENCSTDCAHTDDVQYSENFKRFSDGTYWEK